MATRSLLRITLGIILVANVATTAAALVIGALVARSITHDHGSRTVILVVCIAVSSVTVGSMAPFVIPRLLHRFLMRPLIERFLSRPE